VPLDMTRAANAQRQTPGQTHVALAAILLLSGCGALPAPQVASQNIYVLDAQPVAQTSPIKRDLVLAITPLQARPGFDTPQMIYTQQPHEVSSFVTNRWADTPAHMLEPLLVQAMEQTGSFRAVVQPRGALPADVLLETELIRLRHDFATRPSRVQLTLRARLIDLRDKRVLAVKQFDDAENAASDDAYGGVAAANRVTQRVLKQLADFCVDAAVIQ
jgi:cholesterol transport system auxiliary component